MTDVQPIEDSPQSDPSAHGAQSDSSPSPSPQADQTDANVADPTMAQIDDEVTQAMASMDAADLAELTGEVQAGDTLEPGVELVGTVVGLSDDEVFIEFGPKSQGILPRTQLRKKNKDKDGDDDADAVKVGQSMKVIVDRFDKNAGLMLLRLKGTVQRANWDTLQKGMLVEGLVTGLNKGGLEVDLNGIRGFMPSSQASAAPMKDISILLNQRIRCEVVEVDVRAKNVVLSRRRLLEREQAAGKRKLLEELAVGQTRKGIVRNITDFGAFVDLGGVEGLVHISDLSYTNVAKVTDVLSEGQEIEVKVLKVSPTKDRISLGLKQAQPDPWVNVRERYPVGLELQVKVVRTADFGAFAELEAGIDGLIPISEMAWTRVNTVTDVVKVGDVVKAKVIRLEFEKRRLALSIKQAQDDPWEGVLDGFTVNTVTTGKVTRVTDFGAFVELSPGVEGLIHISELSDKRVKAAGDVVKAGQDVEARILSIDKESRRIALSIKQVKVPEQPVETTMPSGPPPEPKKRKKPLRGGLSSHYNW